jgi:hypothetical protein
MCVIQSKTNTVAVAVAVAVTVAVAVAVAVVPAMLKEKRHAAAATLHYVDKGVCT